MSGDEGGEEAEHHGLWESLRKRLISFRTMDRRVQAVTAVVAVQGVLVAALLVAGQSRFGQIDITNVPGEGLASMPALIFWAAVAMEILGWAYVLGGAHHGTPLLRLVALAFFTYGTNVMWNISARADGAGFGISVASLVGVWLLGAGVWVYDWLRSRAGRPEQRHRHSLRLPTALLTLLLVAGVFAGAFVSGQRSGDPLLVREGIYNQFAQLSYFLIPMLLLAALDFTEVGVVGAEWVADLAGGRRPVLLLGAATAVGAAGVLAISLAGSAVTVRLAFEWLGYALIATLVLGWLASRAKVSLLGVRRIPYSAVAATAVAGFVAQYIALNVIAPGLIPKIPNAPVGTTYSTYVHSHQPVFSIRYPGTWHLSASEPSASQAAGTYDFSGIQSGTPAAYEVFTMDGLDPAGGAEKYGTEYVDSFKGTPKGAWRVANGWHVRDYTVGANLEGTVWSRFEGRRFWALTGYGSVRFDQVILPTFSQMTASWEPRVVRDQAQSMEAAITEAAHGLLAGEAVLWLAVALFAGALLVLLRGRRLPRLLPGGLLYVAVFGLLLFALDLPALAVTLTGRPGDPLTRFPHGIGMAGWSVVSSVLALVFVGAWLTVGRCSRAWAPGLRAAMIFLIGLQLITWLYDGYGAEIGASGRLRLVAALVLLGALAWDVVMSGEPITNVHTEWFPRHTRVAIYMGYEMLVSTAVLFFSSMQIQATGKPIEAYFEPDGWPQQGLAQIGLPFLVTILVLSLVKWAASFRNRGAEPLSIDPVAAEPAAAEPVPV